MRRLASSWSSTLNKLGFRRTRKRSGRHAEYRRRPQIESLELRQMLSITVTTLADQNDGSSANGRSLREAVAEAATSSGADTIEFDANLKGGRVELTLGQITVNSDVTIQGLGADSLTIDANGSSTSAQRIFKIDAGKTAKINDVTLTGGYANAVAGYVGGAIANYGDLELNSVVLVENYALSDGGAVYSDVGHVTVRDSTFQRNTGGSGGGIYAYTNAADGLVVERSAFLDNKAGSGGALLLSGNEENVGTSSIIDCTFSGNSATANGGAIRLDADSTPLLILNSTLVNNIANVSGGGISSHHYGGDITLQNSIVAGNTAGNGAPTNTNNIHNPIASGQNNIIGVGGTGGLVSGTAAHNQVGVSITDLHLAPLGYYGGTTKTYALLAGSVAIDRGINSLVSGVPIDQRGFVRNYNDPATNNMSGETVDIGAFEYGEVIGAAADFNGDGRRTDFASYDPETGSIVAFLQTDHGIDGSAIGHGVGGQFKVGDFNGDGRDDIMFAESPTDSWHLAISEGTALAVRDLGITRAWEFIDYVGDFDGDGADEVIGYDSGMDLNWDVLDYTDEFGGRKYSTESTAIIGWSSPYITYDRIFVGDVNRDGRDDLIVKNTSAGTAFGHWFVGLSKPDPTTKLTFELQDWGNWFDGYLSANGLTLDYDGPYRTLIDAFSDVYNNVELELYAGLMKGPTATEETKSGNDWDQAALLVDNLRAAGFSTAQIVSGRVSVPIGAVENWLGVKPPANPANPADVAKAQAAAQKLLAAFDMPTTAQVVEVSGGNFVFDHAWVQVTAPDTTGLHAINIDPSWKFKNFQDGVSNVPDFKEFSYLAQAGTFYEDIIKDPNHYWDSESKGLSARQLPLDYYEDQVMQSLVDNPATRGLSLADVAYDGPIIQKEFIQISQWTYLFGSPTSYGTFNDIVTGSDTTKNNLTHRITISTGPSTAHKIWDNKPIAGGTFTDYLNVSHPYSSQSSLILSFCNLPFQVRMSSTVTRLGP